VTRTAPTIFQLLNEIAIIEQLSRNALERVLPGGLRQPHVAVLNHLVRLGDGIFSIALARAFQTVKAAMTNTLQRLEARGLIRMEPEDGRGKRVFLTEAEREMRERAIRSVWPMMAGLADTLPEAEASALLPPLRRLRAYLDAARG
jgi:DNA-binding MarR family transcriptional regulator